MARLSDEQWELLEADFHTGIYSKNQLSEKYNISHTAVNKRLKNINPKFQQLVSTQVAIKSELNEQSFKQVSAIETAVNEVLNNKELVFGVTQKALKKLNIMIDSIDDVSEIKTIIDATDKASITLNVNQRHANQQINLTNATQTNITNNELTIDEARKQALDLGVPLELLTK